MTQIGEPVNVGLASDEESMKIDVLRGGIVEVTFISDVKVAYAQGTVAEPHWQISSDLREGLYSKRPAVYLVKGKGNKRTATVKVKITESTFSGTGKLLGRLGIIEFTGDCPLSAGDHPVDVEIREIPETIQWIFGDIQWGLEVQNQSISLNATRAELYFVLNTPTDIYQQKNGVWVEALRFLCRRAGLIGVKEEREAANRVAYYCHSRHGLKYDSAGGGRSSYGVGPNGGTFKLRFYLRGLQAFANCYDQAAAVQALAGCVGVKLSWIFLEPYGFIKLTNLLGYGNCNNPFFLGNNSPQLIGRNDARRTPFGNHAFCAFPPKVLDACAGPHLSSEGYEEYVEASIDAGTSLYSLYTGFRPGKAYDMQWSAGVTEVE